MNEFAKGLAFMVALQILLFSVQLAFGQISVETGQNAPVIYNYQGSLLQTYDNGNYTVRGNITDSLPSSNAGVQPQTNVFLFPFQVILNWIQSIPGVGYVIGFLNAFPNFLKILGLPVELSFMGGVFWYCTGFILLISWLKN